MWFQRLTGFDERTAPDVAAMFEVEGEWITSRANGRRMRAGRFEMPALAELRRRRTFWAGRGLVIDQVVTDVQSLLAEQSSAGATFQVASQFNMLEMTSPSVTPEDGIDRYESDHTQGPASAIACGAGTIFRNYLVGVDGGTGQTAGRQLNGLTGVADELDVDLEVRNGYALPTAAQLRRIAEVLDGADEAVRDRYRGRLQVGVQSDTEVTLGDAGHTVTQVCCSALPISYGSPPTRDWEPFARLVLEAAYEATFAVAAARAQESGNANLYLTLLGGGAFGNPVEWVLDAIRRAMVLYANDSLEVHVVSHAHRRPDVDALAQRPPRWPDELFAAPPSQWGMRGDPHLWRELAARLGTHPEPASGEELAGLLHRELRHLTGVDIATSPETAVQVLRYPTSGMSGGFISPPTWRDRVIPMLVGRFPAASTDASDC